MKCCWVTTLYPKPSQLLCGEPVVEQWVRRSKAAPPPGLEKYLAFAPIIYFCAGHALESEYRRTHTSRFMNYERHVQSIHEHFEVGPFDPNTLTEDEAMVFKQEIELGNDAMQTYEDIAKSLEQTAAKLRTYAKVTVGESGRIMDRNGNSVGRWRIEKE